MMQLPSLLQNEATEVIPTQTFTDLQCTKLFSEQTRRVLSRPCDKETLRMRQDTFRVLDEEQCNRLRELLPILSHLKHVEEKLWQTDSRTEGIFLQCTRLETLLQVMDHLSAQNPAGPLFLRIKEVLESKGARSFRTLAQQAATEGRKKLDSISRVDIKNGILPCDESKTCNDILLEYGRFLGCDIQESRAKKLPLGKAEGEYFQGFSEILLQTEELLSPYQNISSKQIVTYEEEIKFFLEIYELCQEAKKKDVPLCFPEISETPTFAAQDLYDITLLRGENTIIPNDAWFTKEEPFFFLTGANGGGKTTYLRAVGCNLILALAGCPIFATDATVYPFTTVLSHFPEDERFDIGGRLDNELRRAKSILSTKGTPFLLFNEPYSSTDDLCGFEELKKTCESLKTNKSFGICVTHLHQVTTLDFPQLSTIVEETANNRRTFRIRRQQGQNSSFATDILKKYGLDEQSLRERRMRRENQPLI